MGGKKERETTEKVLGCGSCHLVYTDEVLATANTLILSFTSNPGYTAPVDMTRKNNYAKRGNGITPTNAVIHCPGCGRDAPASMITPHTDYDFDGIL